MCIRDRFKVCDNLPKIQIMKKLLITSLNAIKLLIPLLLITLIIIVLSESTGNSKPFLAPDGKKIPGSISLKETVFINGLYQKMIIRGRDSTKPVSYTHLRAHETV